MKNILLVLLFLLAGRPGFVFAEHDQMVAKEGSRDISGQLVVDVNIPWRYSPGFLQKPFHWHLVIVAPDGKQYHFPYFDAGAFHSQTIPKLKKGIYTIKIIDDDLSSPYYYPVTPNPYFVRIKYQATNGQFFDVSLYYMLASLIWGPGASIDYTYTVSKPSPNTEPYTQ
jgi:hypothetical protein